MIYGVGDTKKEAVEDHNKNLRVFLERCRSKGIKLNKQKSKLTCSENHLYTDKGLKAAPKPSPLLTCRFGTMSTPYDDSVDS